MNDKYSQVEVCHVFSEMYNEGVHILNDCGICQIEDTIQDMRDEDMFADIDDVFEVFELVVQELRSQGFYAKVINIDEAILEG